MKATFFDRIFAYIIDTVIVSVLLSVICLGLPSVNSNEEKVKELSERLTKEEITFKEYADEYSDILYDTHKDNMLQNGISLALTAAYFVIFQYLNKGQTLGKKLLRLRVVEKDTEKPITILKGLLRSLFILGILTSGLSLILINVLKNKDYITAYECLSMIETLFIFVTAVLVIARKDHRGLHDMMANTDVIKEGR